MTAAALAADLGVDPGYVEVLLGQLDEPVLELPDDLAEFLRRLLDPHGERTAPAGLYWPDAEPKPRQTYGWADRTRQPTMAATRSRSSPPRRGQRHPTGR